MKRAATVLIAGLVSLAIPAVARADEPPAGATMQASCEAVTFNVTGYPEGSMVFLWGNSGMPYQFIVGQPAGWYTSQPGGGSGSLPMGGTATSWDWAVDVRTPDGVTVRPVGGHIDCGTPETEEVVPEEVKPEPQVEAEAAAVEPLEPAPVVVDIWAHVALAPPW